MGLQRWRQSRQSKLYLFAFEVIARLRTRTLKELILVSVTRLQPWVSPRDIVEDHARRTSLHNTNNNNNIRPTAPNNPAPKIRKELRVPSEIQGLYSTSSRTNPASAQAYRAKVDMAGFKNDEISLDLDDRRLIVSHHNLARAP